MYLSGTDIQHATQGEWLNLPSEKVKYVQIKRIQTDSRHFKQDDAFLALRGPHFDGHTFAHQLQGKASILIGDQQGTPTWAALKTPQLEVRDTLLALGDIAYAWRKKLTSTTVIAITGSYGKTTVRSMLAHSFKALNINITETHANLNNLIGVPMTLLDVQADTEIALIECGISEPGEMKRLAKIVQPDIAILTGITSAHAEGLGGLHGVVREKSLLLESVSPQGWCALGQDVRKHLKNIGHNTIETFVDWQLQGNKLHLSHHAESASLTLALPAAHWGANMALVASIVIHYFKQKSRPIKLTQLTDILASWQPIPGRMQTLTGINNSIVLDDSYNANPISMQAALNTLAAMPQRHIAILGDMAELGDATESIHQGLDVSGVDMLILVGKHMRALHQQHATSQWFADTNALLAWLGTQQSMFTDQDTILIKASHSMQLQHVVSLLTGQGDNHVI